MQQVILEVDTNVYGKSGKGGTAKSNADRKCKLCPECNRVWEKHISGDRPVVEYYPIPRIGKDPEVCPVPDCKNFQGERYFLTTEDIEKSRKQKLKKQK